MSNTRHLKGLITLLVLFSSSISEASDTNTMSAASLKQAVSESEINTNVRDISDSPALVQLIRRGGFAQRNQDYEQAVLIWRQVIELNPGSLAAHNSLGVSLAQLRRYEEAIASFQAALHINPNNTTIQDNLAVAQHNLIIVSENQRQSGNAIGVNQQAVYSNSEMLNEYIRQGNLAQLSGNYAQAENIWRRFVQIDPNNAIAHNNLGVSLSELGRSREAISFLRRAIELDPAGASSYRNNLSSAYSNLCVLLREQGAERAAIECNEEAIAANPESPVSYHNNAIALANNRQFEKSVEQFNLAIERIADELGLNHQEICYDELPEVIERNSSYAKICTDLAAAYNNWGLELSDQGQLEEAINKFEISTQLNRNDVEAFVNLGVAYKELGQLNDADRVLTIAIRIEPGNTIARSNRDEVRNILNAVGRSIDSTVVNLNVNNRIPDTIRRSVVMIGIQTNDEYMQIGTGWVIQRQGDSALILTNRHVVQEEDRQLRGNITVDFFGSVESTQGQRQTARVIQVSTEEQSDLALLQISNVPADIEPITISSRDMGAGEPVGVIGFPIRSGVAYDQGGDVVTGEVTNISDGLLRLNVNLAEGNSGSPVLNRQNQAVGVVFSLEPADPINATAGVGTAYSMKTILAQLQNWGINLESP